MKKKFIIISLVSVLLLSIGLSYSYFTGQVNGEDKKLEVIAKNVRILFTDDKEISNSTIKPGWSEVKSFSVKNESEGIFNYNIVFEKLVNTFVTEGYLKYKITSTDGGYSMADYADVPKSPSSKDYVLAYDIDIEPRQTHNYTIEFVYINDENADQSVDMGKEFSGNLAIIEGSVDPNIKYTVTMNIDESIGTVSPTRGETLKKGNLDFTVTPKNESDISTMNVECDPVANKVILGNNIKINDIRQNHNCNITMDKKKYTVEIKVNNGSSNALNKIIEHGGSDTATITPDYGYTLTGATVVGEGCSLSNGTLTISNVTKAGTCEITLLKDKFNVTLSGSNVKVSNSPQQVEYEGSTTFTVTPNTGITFNDMVVNCDGDAESSINGSTVTISNVTAVQTCTVTLPKLKYSVNISVNNSSYGSVSPSSTTVEHGNSLYVTITPKTGYKYSSNTCGGSVSGNTMAISNIIASKSCSVSFTTASYAVSVSVRGGTASPTSRNVLYGESATFDITVSNGYLWDSYVVVSGSGCSADKSSRTVIVAQVTEDTTCGLRLTKVCSDEYQFGVCSASSLSCERTCNSNCVSYSCSGGTFLYYKDGCPQPTREDWGQCICTCY